MSDPSQGEGSVCDLLLKQWFIAPITVADPGFPIGGHGPWKRGHGPLRQLCFTKILHVEMKESGPIGGHVPGVPLDPPMHQSYFTMGKSWTPIDCHCKNFNSLIQSSHTWNIVKKCPSQIYKHSKSDLDTYWQCFMCENSELSCWNFYNGSQWVFTIFPL